MSDPICDEFEGSVYSLSLAYLCILANGTPHYSLLDLKERELFEQFTRNGELVRAVEQLKHDAEVEAQSFGLKLSDQSLSEFCMCRVCVGQPLPPADQSRLSAIIDHLQATYRRLDSARTRDARNEGATHALNRLAVLPTGPVVLQLTDGSSAPRGPAFKSVTDGPEGGRRLRWNGKQTNLSGVIYRLVAHMWERDSAGYEQLMSGAVWDSFVEPQTVRSAVNKANNALASAGVPWKLSADSRSRVVTKAPRN